MPLRLSEANFKRLKAGKPVKLGNKYHAQKTADGFDSKHEGNLWGQLKLLEKLGEVQNLRRQVDYPFNLNGVHICTYRADFVFEERGMTAADADRLGWRLVVADAKSDPTRKKSDYRIKYKLMQAMYQITIREMLKPKGRRR